MKKLITLAIAASMTAMAVAGCAGSAQSESAPAEQETAQEETRETAEQADQSESTAEESSDIATLEEGRLIVGTNAEFPPFEYVGDDGEPDGFDIALINAIGEKLGLEVEIQNMEFASLVSSIGSKVDVSIAGMTITDERKEMVDFSEPYYDAVQYVLLPVDSDVHTADDLAGKNIGSQLGTTGNFIADDVEGAASNPYDKPVDAVTDLINGRNDLVIVDKNPALVFEANFEGQIVAVPGSQFGFEDEQYAIALPKGSALTPAINSALEELRADGTFDELVREYIEVTE